MFRTGIISAVALALGFGTAAPVRADDDDDDWDDYRERLEDLREERRERYEDWLDDQREAREDYYDRLRDQNRRWSRSGFGGPPAFYPGASYYYPGTSYYRGPTYTYPGSVYYPGWNGVRYDDYRPGGFQIRGPRGRGFSFRW